MELFCRKKRVDVHSFMLNVANNHCEEIQSLYNGDRQDKRTRLTMVVLILPMENGRPVIERTFAVVTQEISSEGLTLVLTEPRKLDQVLIAFRSDSSTVFIQGDVKHLSPMGAGFHRMGVHLTKVVSAGEHSGLSSLDF